MRVPSRFIPAPHPKTEIRPDPVVIEKILRSGWVGQMKVHGHRAQVHLCADSATPAIAYTRHGMPHKLAFPPEMEKELRRLLSLNQDWTAVDAEWLKPEKHLYLFDYLKRDGEELGDLSYSERYALLPKDFISPYVTVLPLLKTTDKCLAVLSRPEEMVEGVVFKSLSTPGFSDSSVIRCRKR